MDVLLLAAGVVAFAILAGAIYQAIGAARDARRFPPPGRMVDAGGFRLHVHEAGSGSPAVVLEAGIAASSLSWSLVWPEVAKFARVIRYDRAGLAWSDAAPRHPRTAAQLAAELYALLENAQIAGPYVLVGHSFGGYVARMFHVNHPGRVAGLVLLDSPSTSDWIPMKPEEQRRVRGGALFSRIGAALAALGVVRFCLARLSSGSLGLPVIVTRSFGRSALTVVGRLLGEVQKLPVEVWPQVQAHWCQPKSFLSMASHLAHLPESAAQVEATGALGEIPLTVLTASRPSPERFAAQEAVARLSARGKHIVAETSGHWIHLDEPELVVQAIRSMCEAVRGDRS